MTEDLGRPAPRFSEGDRVVRERSPDVIGEVLSAPEWDCGDWWLAARRGCRPAEGQGAR